MILLILLTVSAVSVAGLCLLSSSIINADIERRNITDTKTAVLSFLALTVALIWLDLYFWSQIYAWLSS